MMLNDRSSLSGRDFGTRLRWWRGKRGLSQLELAVTAGASQRHLSFLESGRTRPSREMVEIRIESFFPAEPATKALFQRRAGDAAPR
jgi:DNA-binding XRE family transcriptional regulator